MDELALFSQSTEIDETMDFISEKSTLLSSLANPHFQGQEHVFKESSTSNDSRKTNVKKTQLKRKVHSFAEKAEILREVDAKVLSKAKICRKYGIPSGTLSTWIKHKEKISLASSVGVTKKRLRGINVHVSKLPIDLHDMIIDHMEKRLDKQNTKKKVI